MPLSLASSPPVVGSPSVGFQSAVSCSCIMPVQSSALARVCQQSILHCLASSPLCPLWLSQHLSLTCCLFFRGIPQCESSCPLTPPFFVASLCSRLPVPICSEPCVACVK